MRRTAHRPRAANVGPTGDVPFLRVGVQLATAVLLIAHFGNNASRGAPANEPVIVNPAVGAPSATGDPALWVDPLRQPIAAAAPRSAATNPSVAESERLFGKTGSPTSAPTNDLAITDLAPRSGELLDLASGLRDGDQFGVAAVAGPDGAVGSVPPPIPISKAPSGFDPLSPLGLALGAALVLVLSATGWYLSRR